MTQDDQPKQWSHAGEDGWGEDWACQCGKEFATRDEAIATAAACMDMKPEDEFMTGRGQWERCTDLDPPFADSVSDLISETAGQMPGDYGDSFDPTPEQRAELAAAFAAAWKAWLDTHDIHPSVERIVDVETHTVPRPSS